MLIKQPTRLKFGMRFPNNWVSITNHMCGQLVLSGHYHTHRTLLCLQKLIYGQISQKFGIWSPSNQVNIINHMCVWRCVKFGISCRKLFWLPKANYRTNQDEIWPGNARYMLLVIHKCEVHKCIVSKLCNSSIGCNGLVMTSLDFED